jgi:hypothetical protein
MIRCPFLPPFPRMLIPFSPNCAERDKFTRKLSHEPVIVIVAFIAITLSLNASARSKLARRNDLRSATLYSSEARNITRVHGALENAPDITRYACTPSAQRREKGGKGEDPSIARRRSTNATFGEKAERAK